jgi:hypothetical protein
MGNQPLIFALLILLATQQLLGSQSFAETAFDPLSVGIGARALGMGGAYVAVAEDGDALFNNPAGLGEIDSLKLTSMAGNILEDVNYTVLGAVTPLGEKSAVGLGYAGSFVTGIELRDNYGILSRKANYGDSVIFASFGRKLTEKLSLGIGLKYYFTDGTEIDSGDGKGLNLDFGILQKGWDWLSLGLVGQNLLSSGRMNYQNEESEALPLKLKAGAKIYLMGSGFGAAVVSPLELILAFDTHFLLQETRSMTLHGGLEFSPNPFLTFRGGVDQTDPTAGLSIRFAGIGFHYAYQPNNCWEPYGQYFSITIDERGWPTEEDVYLAKRPAL